MSFCCSNVIVFVLFPVEPDGDSRLDYMSPPKRFHSGPSTPDRLLPHPLTHRYDRLLPHHSHTGMTGFYPTHSHTGMTGSYPTHSHTGMTGSYPTHLHTGMTGSYPTHLHTGMTGFYPTHSHTGMTGLTYSIGYIPASSCQQHLVCNVLLQIDIYYRVDAAIIL